MTPGDIASIRDSLIRLGSAPTCIQINPELYDLLNPKPICQASRVLQFLRDRYLPHAPRLR